MNVTDEIKNRLDIVDVISDYVQLRKSGHSYSGFCPFHSNTRTPAFVVFPSTQTWRCFGACAEGGDVFSFLMKKQGWEFKETLAHLAERAGVKLEERGPADREQQTVEDRLTDLLTAAADYFHQLLLYAPQAEFVRQYVAGRGLNEGTVATFKLGYALDSWDACRSHFNMQGYGDDELLDAGLLTVHETKGSRYDRFRHRLMVPIYDVDGRIAGFGARTLDPDGLPKYLNSPQTAVFDKSRLLFGLDKAKRHIREARQVVIVEGYMDVIQAWQAGFRNVVAQMGTALTEEQLRLAKRYSKRFVLALDADAAGAKATLRSLEVARETLDREGDVRFDARGLVRHEGRLQADIRIVTLPEGNDPDKVIRTDPTLWPKLVAQAQPVVAYVIDVVTRSLDLDDPKAKTAAAQEVLPLIGDVVDPIEREHYRQMLARALRIDERVLHKVSLPAGRGRSQPRPAALPAPEKPGTAGLVVAMSGKMAATDLRQANYLRQCLSYPQLMAQVDKKLTLNRQPAIAETDFTRPDDRALWRYLRQQAGQRTVAAGEDLCDSLQDEVLCQRLQALLTLPQTPESELDRLPDSLVLSVLDWRLEQVRSLMDKVMQLWREAQVQANPDMVDMYGQQYRELTQMFLRMSKAQGAMSGMNRQAAQESSGTTTGQV
ncbi:MAG: DNA primase [Chloroflexi bacterium]|nr:DNA primase [Chloroflexota bacterium]MCI0579192.1 DNA primase [Chloroflexota bacterium]MCI0645271.1 DNA primase [Chloroflexota bacterium]MCI0726775.1 DNA primase [Chloroflexota bacterium]